MSLKALPAESRPREKLLARGPGALSNAELLALLLRSGLPGKNVLQLAEELAQRFGGLSGLLHAQAEDLKAIKGLESRNIAFTFYNLRSLEQLLTLESRQEVQLVLQDSHSSLKDIEEAIRRARHKMCCKFTPQSG